MKFKTIFLLTLLLLSTSCAIAEIAEPVMPTDPNINSDITIPTQIPDTMPTANQEPVLLPVLNIIQEEKQIEQPSPVIAGANPAALQPPSQPEKTLQKQEQPNTTTIPKIVTSKPKQIEKPKEGTLTDSELDFEVENQTGKTIYITCFSYIKKRQFSRWHWNKSPIYKLEDNKSVTVDLPFIADPEDRNNTFGYLGIFENIQEAEDSTIELLDDSKKIDLDIIAQLHGKKVTIEIEKYGIVGEFYDFDFKDIDKKKDAPQQPELDFYVENKTGKTILVTCFVYEKKAKGTWLAKKTKEAWTSEENTRDDMSLWRFDKTPVIKIKPNEHKLIDVDTIIEARDRIYVRGYIAIFDKDEQDLADKSIYELPQSKQRLDLGRLIDLKHKKISIYTEKYGAAGNTIDYVVKPAQKPDIQKVITGYFK